MPPLAAHEAALYLDRPIKAINLIVLQEITRVRKHELNDNVTECPRCGGDMRHERAAKTVSAGELFSMDE